MKRVMIESPFAADTEEQRIRNETYLKAAIEDCLSRGEAPFASHGFYPSILDDAVPGDRRLGMQAGFAWADVAEAVVVYVDLGTSRGMAEGISRAVLRGIPVIHRTLGPGWTYRLLETGESVRRIAESMSRGDFPSLGSNGRSRC